MPSISLYVQNLPCPTVYCPCLTQMSICQALIVQPPLWERNTNSDFHRPLTVHHPCSPGKTYVGEDEKELQQGDQQVESEGRSCQAVAEAPPLLWDKFNLRFSSACTLYSHTLAWLAGVTGSHRQAMHFVCKLHSFVCKPHRHWCVNYRPEAALFWEVWKSAYLSATCLKWHTWPSSLHIKD